MDYREADGLCLRAVDYGESDKILTLYCAGMGKITVSARGARKPKAKLKYACVPLCFGRYSFTVTDGRRLLTGCECTDSFYGLTADLPRYYAALCALELLDRISAEEDYNAALFPLTLHFLNVLCYDAPAEDAVRQALYRYYTDAIGAAGFRADALTLRDVARFCRDRLDLRLRALDEFLKL